jgi:hypothetical protein
MCREGSWSFMVTVSPIGIGGDWGEGQKKELEIRTGKRDWRKRPKKGIE